jgi:hypothetical protein
LTGACPKRSLGESTPSFADLIGESMAMTTMDSPVKPANDGE